MMRHAFDGGLRRSGYAKRSDELRVSGASGGRMSWSQEAEALLKRDEAMRPCEEAGGRRC
jgi:hypothetical protein